MIMPAHLSRSPGFFYLTQALDVCSSLSADVVLHHIESIWWWVREAVVLPVVKAAVVSCLIMSVILVVEKVSMAAVSLFVMVFRRTPEKVYKWEPLSLDAELGSSAFPMVLVQIPMFNEREVPNYRLASLRHSFSHSLCGFHECGLGSRWVGVGGQTAKELSHVGSGVFGSGTCNPIGFCSAGIDVHLPNCHLGKADTARALQWWMERPDGVVSLVGLSGHITWI